MPFSDPERQREYQRERLAATRAAWLAEHGPCVRCGSDVDLEVDHVDPGTKVNHRVWSWSPERREAELRKCQVLCGDCHRAKTSAERAATPIQHGTAGGYTKRKCRCRLCADAHNAVKREWYAKRRALLR